jgi:tRNA threonylcarbamoyladenosine biosynthesis protein TsaE
VTATGAAPPTGTRSLSLRTHSVQETRELAASLATAARRGDRIWLLGPLGAGKTQFAKGFAAGLGVREVVNSPTFTLMAEYEGRLRLFHQDLYRLSGAEDAVAAGLLDERQDDGVTLTEWADRLDERIDAERLVVRIEPGDGDVREVRLATSMAEVADRYLPVAGGWAAERR